LIFILLVLVLVVVLEKMQDNVVKGRKEFEDENEHDNEDEWRHKSHCRYKKRREYP